MIKAKNISHGFWAVLALWVGFLALLCLVPPVSRDALVHHLAVPKIYLQHKGMVEIPSMEWSYYPMNLTLLYWGALALGSDIFSKFIHLAFGLATAFLIFRYLRIRACKNWGLFGALLFLSIPVVMKLSTTVYVDLGLSFFSFGATMALFRAREKGFSSFCGVAAAGLLFGLGMGIKYNALPLLVIMTALVALLASRKLSDQKKGGLKALFFAGVFVASAVVAYSPTGVRNTLWTGNPIYPLYDGAIQKLWTIGARGAEEAHQAAASQGVKLYPLQVRRMLYNESALEVSFLPLRIFFQGEDGNPRLFDGKFSPVLLLSILSLVFLGRIPKPWRAEVAGMHLLSWGFVIMAISLADVRVRYLMPIVPHLTVLAVLGLKCAVDLLKAHGHSVTSYVGACVLAGFLAYGVWVSGRYGAYLYNYVKPLDYLSGKVDRDGYVARYRFEHPAFVYANENLQPTDRIFFVNLGKRGYHCNIPYIPDERGNHFEVLAGVSSTAAFLRSPEGMRGYLRRRGVTHILAYMPIAWRNVVEGEAWPDEGRQSLEDFLGRHTRKLFSANGVCLFELR